MTNSRARLAALAKTKAMMASSKLGGSLSAPPNVGTCERSWSCGIQFSRT